MGGLGVNQSSSRGMDLYGGQSRANAQRYQQQFGGPQSRAFGWGYDPESNFGQQLSSRADAGNPFAQYLQTTQSILPQVQADAARAGQEIASRAPGAFQGYMSQAQGYLNDILPSLQGQVGRGFGAIDQAQGAVNLGGAQHGVDSARQFLDQAASPIQSNALYQNALRQATQASQQAAAGRGLLDAGSQVGREEGLARDLAGNFAQQQFGNQQAALQGYGGALGQQNQAAGLLGQLAGQRGGLAQLGGALGQSGIETSQGIMQALPYYAQLLQSGSQLPFQAAQQLQGFFAASQNPTLALLQATAPQIGQSSKGWHA